jgi:hypothetical protein
MWHQSSPTVRASVFATLLVNQSVRVALSDTALLKRKPRFIHCSLLLLRDGLSYTTCFVYFSFFFSKMALLSKYQVTIKPSTVQIRLTSAHKAVHSVCIRRLQRTIILRSVPSYPLRTNLAWVCTLAPQPGRLHKLEGDAFCPTFVQADFLTLLLVALSFKSQL